MKLLVTGGSGLVGRFVVDALLANHEVEVLDAVMPRQSKVRCHVANILHRERVVPILRSGNYEAVVHLAGIPHPLVHPPEVVFATNVNGTRNILEASALAGVRSFVFMSSESTLGFAFSTKRRWPDFVPIDESHPTIPEDPYGQSKVVGEALCARFSREYGMQTVSLRAPWIWCPVESELPMYRALVNNHGQWHKNLWAWVHVFDVARAIENALRASFPERNETMFICSDANWTGRESRELVAAWYPETRVKPDLTGPASLISSQKAERLLGFRPQLTVEDLLGER